MRIFDPPHPGEILREDCLKPWLRNQLSYDLWHARRRARGIKIKPFPAVEAE